MVGGRTVLVFRGASKKFGDHWALRGCDFAIPRQSIWALIGANGAGKTTCLRLAAGLEEPTEGIVTVAGIDIVRRRKEASSLIGFCPDVPFLYDFLTGEEFLRFLAGLWGLDPEVRENRIEKLLHVTGLSQSARRVIGEYSRGMRQKLGLAGALLHGPRLLLLDEPFTNVDGESEAEMKNLLRDFAREGGSVLFATHRMDLVRDLAEGYVHLAEGQVVNVVMQKNSTLRGGVEG